MDILKLLSIASVEEYNKFNFFENNNTFKKEANVALTYGLLLDEYEKAKTQGGRTGVTLRRRILELTGRNLNENSLITKRRHIIEEMRRKNSQEDIDALRSTLWTIYGVQKEPINKKQDNQVSSQPTRESIDGFDIWQSELRIDQRLVMCKVCSKDGYMMREVRQETMQYYDLHEGENLCRLCYHKWYNKCVRMRRKKEFSEGSDDESIGEDQYSPSSRRSMRKKSRIQSRGTNLPLSYNVSDVQYL